MSDFDDYYLSGSPEKRDRVILRAFVDDVRNHKIPTAQALASAAKFVAAHLSERKGKRGRRPAPHTDFQSWASYFALYCDKGIMKLPKLDGEPDEAALALKLPIAGQQMQNLADKFKDDLQPADIFQLPTHWEKYAKNRGWPITDKTLRRMTKMWRPRVPVKK